MSTPEINSNAENSMNSEQAKEVNAIQEMFRQRMLGANVFAIGEAGPIPEEEWTQDHKNAGQELLDRIHKDSK